MGLKEKAKGIWKRVSDLDDEREPANALTGEKGRIPYKDISKKLKEVMKQNVDVVGRKIIIPSYYAILFNETDRKMRIEVEDTFCEELKEELYHEMRKINPEQNKRDVIIEIQTDRALDDGQFRIEHHIKKPAAGDRIKEQSPIQKSAVEEELDYQQTVIEQTLSPIPDDQQTVVMSKSTADMLYTLVVDSGEEKREIDITKKTISIGRGTRDDVNLASPDFSISRSHAVITVQEDGFYLTPAGINGTVLNGRELELNKQVRIAVGDEIRIMNYILKIL